MITMRVAKTSITFRHSALEKCVSLPEEAQEAKAEEPEHWGQVGEVVGHVGGGHGSLVFSPSVLLSTKVE